MKPRLSIITVTKNAASRIPQTIHSVQAQNFKAYEHWIIDGLSNDDTLKKIEELKYSKLKFISEKDHGIYDAMNKGARLAKGEYLLFLNAGDHLYDEKALGNIFRSEIPQKNNKKPDLIVANIQTLNEIDESNKAKEIAKANKINESNKLSKERIQIWRPVQLLKHPHTFQILPHCGVFIKRDFLLACGAYNIKYKIAGDIEFFNRALRKYKASYTYLDTTLSVFYRDGISSSFWGKALAYKEELQIHWRYYGIMNTLRRIVPLPYLGLWTRLLAMFRAVKC